MAVRPSPSAFGGEGFLLRRCSQDEVVSLACCPENPLVNFLGELQLILKGLIDENALWRLSCPIRGASRGAITQHIEPKSVRTKESRPAPTLEIARSLSCF
jgi:hypothetical protein